MTEQSNAYVPWKRYTFAVAEAVIVFSVASFFLGLLIMHHAEISTIAMTAAAITYVLIVGFSIYRMVRKFSLAANMLMIPIAPLIILIIVVSLIQLLEFFK